MCIRDRAGTFVECGLCGTAAVISPVGEIDNKVYGADETVTFPAGYTEIGPCLLYTSRCV